jgi:hypothetical protein
VAKKLDVQTCIDCYLKIAQEVFIPKKRASVVPSLVLKSFGSAIFSAKRLEEAIGDVLQKCEPQLEKDTPLRISTEQRCNV